MNLDISGSKSINLLQDNFTRWGIPFQNSVNYEKGQES